MRYKILTEMGHGHMNEEGTEGVRRGALGGLEQRLWMAIKHADEARDFARGRQVAENLPDIGKGRVRALVDFHEKQQSKHLVTEQANAEVIRIRQWLHRQHASLTPEGIIIWPRSRRTVVYDRQLAEQNLSRITIRNGMLFTADGKPLDTRRMVTHFSGPGYAIYVMSKEGNLHVSSHSVGHRHHSSLLAGGMVAGAGELRVNEGRIAWISNKSGHYQPNVDHMLQALHSLWLRGVRLDFRIMLLPGGREYANWDAFAVDNGFDDSTVETLQILHGYGHYLTLEFLQRNRLEWVPQTSGALLGGIYDVTYSPWRRVSYNEFAAKMHAAGMAPKFVYARGVGR